jgi:hypothetical protein
MALKSRSKALKQHRDYPDFLNPWFFDHPIAIPDVL